MAEYFKFKESNCRNCHKCIRHCPVKSISFYNNQAHIIADECILCGECFVTCPQNAKSIRDDLPKARQLLAGGREVYVSVAPSAAAVFPDSSFESLRDALIGLGFAGAEETAVGAAIVKKRYEQLVREGEQRVIISSCCHSVNMLIQKYYPDAAQCLARVVSPMIAHGIKLKREHPESAVVFIGPCISKKAEADEYPGIIDCVLTFEDLALWLEQEHVAIPRETHAPEKGGKTRIFPTSGGILDSMDIGDGMEDYAFIAVDGVKNCIAALEDVAAGNLDNCFIEMSACIGSCIGGPAIGKERRPLIRDRMAVRKNAGREDFAVKVPDAKALEHRIPFAAIRRVSPGGKAIEDVLRKMGKTLPEHELNCESCGYETCRKKAAAVLAGKAEITMCLPYLMARAESFSDNIIGNTPTGIIVLNRSMEIRQINATACRMMNIKDEQAVLGRNVVCILDPTQFVRAIATSQNTCEQHVYLAEYGRHVMMTIVIDATYDIIIGFMRDITEEYAVHESKGEQSLKAMEIADRVIEKQMRTVQEIASLLGETTAETKVALERLKETLRE